MCSGGGSVTEVPGGVSGVRGPEGKVPDAYRLPEEVQPTHYDLIFKTDLETLTFDGEGYIHLNVLEDTKSITLNFNPSIKLTHLVLHHPSLPTPYKYDTSSTSSASSLLSIESKQERLIISLPESLSSIKAGDKNVKLRMAWTSELNGSMLGYYRSSWKPEGQGGKEAYYALTQFEPTSARRAFPCWDEPLLKSTYSISLISRKGLVSLSNMPAVGDAKPWTGGQGGEELGALLESSKGGEWEITEFMKTPLVSTYLVAFANGEFSSLESHYVSPLSGKTIPLKSYATPDHIKQAQFALDVKAKAMPVYEEIFDVEYPLPKLDTLTAEDFDAGAMENWGLITGRTSVFLYDEKKSGLAAKKRVIDVVSHECAHMWFGNVVTMAWWDNLWLNEAFATYMGEVVIPDRIFPEFKVRQAFLNNHLAAALSLDSVRSSHPIEVDCPDANQINQIFDSISYSKGGSVLRMLASVVGEEKFLKGVSIYLKKRLFGNSVTKDLWDGISEASGMDVASIMANWTLKIGFPVITVEEIGGKIKVRQDRFLNTGDVKPEENETLWYVPLELKTVKDGKVSVDHKAVLSERETTLDLGGAKTFKLNAETVGVYRVAYSAERLALLGEEAAKADSAFSVEDRVGLVSDAMTLCRAGASKTSGALSLVNQMVTEQEYLVWSSIFTGLAKVKAVWWEQPEEVRKAVDALNIKLARPLVDRLGYEFPEGEDPTTRELRTLAVSVAAGSEDPDVLAELKRRFQPFLEKGDDSLIHADLQRSIFTNAVRHGGEAEWKKVREVYGNPPNPSTKIDALMSLGATKKPELIEMTFKMLEDGTIKDQDVMYGFVSLSSNRITRRQIGTWFKDNYDPLVKRFADNFAMNRLVSYAFNSLTTDEDLADIDAFFKDKETEKYKLSLAQTRDAVMASASWLKRDQQDVEKWLKENQFL